MEQNETGKQLSVFTVLRALKRRKLYLLAPVLLVTAAVWVYTLRLPDRFRARTLIAAAEPVIPANYLGGSSEAATPVNIEDQLRTIRETLFGRAVLEAVNAEFHLYDGPDGQQEQALAALKSRIQIQVAEPDAC